MLSGLYNPKSKMEIKGKRGERRDVGRSGVEGRGNQRWSGWLLKIRGCQGGSALARLHGHVPRALLGECARRITFFPTTQPALWSVEGYRLVRRHQCHLRGNQGVCVCSGQPRSSTPTLHSHRSSRTSPQGRPRKGRRAVCSLHLLGTLSWTKAPEE